MTTQAPQNEQWLILDTNIIHFLHDEARRDFVKSLLLDAAQKGFKPALSEITVSEALTNAKPSDYFNIKQAIGELNTFPVTSLVLELAALLHNCYKNESALKNMSEDTTCDRIIAATAILQGGQLLTGNARTAGVF